MEGLLLRAKSIRPPTKHQNWGGALYNWVGILSGYPMNIIAHDFHAYTVCSVAGVRDWDIASSFLAVVRQLSVGRLAGVGMYIYAAWHPLP